MARYNYLIVKMLTDDDGNPYPNNDWHFTHNAMGASMVYCDGHVFGNGESSAEFQTRLVTEGGITCPDCIRRIKEIQKIKL